MKKNLYMITLLFCDFLFCAPREASFNSVTFLELVLSENKELDVLFFAPDEGRVYKELLLTLIAQEKKSIKAALFRLTDKAIANALVAAHARGVTVEVIFDAGAVTSDHYSLAYTLKSHGILVYRYQATDLFTRKHTKKRAVKKEKYQTLMHQKTFIFEDTLGGAVVAFGSLNPTTAGFYGNEEAVQLRNKKEIVEKFKKQLIKIKSRSCDIEGDWRKMGDRISRMSSANRGLRRSSLLQSLLS